MAMHRGPQTAAVGAYGRPTSAHLAIVFAILAVV
jgi:hypothetical protein